MKYHKGIWIYRGIIYDTLHEALVAVWEGFKTQTGKEDIECQ